MTDTAYRKGWQRHNCRTGSVIFIHPRTPFTIEYDPIDALYYVGTTSFTALLDAMDGVADLGAQSA